jgi:hypothetical protein
MRLLVALFISLSHPSAAARSVQGERSDNDAYSGEDDRLFCGNMTGDSDDPALLVFSTRIGHDQSRFLGSASHSRV